jgi:NitT/TauT family transport system ATP-binding protein
MDIELRNINKAYGNQQVLADFSADFAEGRVSCIMAPSGWGKTTLIRLMMGLEQIDGGEMTGLEGLRKSAVFQEDRLCENLSAAANIRLVCPEKSRQSVEKEMSSFGLGGDALGKPVRELSGGMRRRVALLRALLASYDILYMDEPFKGLDDDTKGTVMTETRRLASGKTVILLTHDRTEAVALEASEVIDIADMERTD